MKFNLTTPFASLVHKKSETPPPPRSGQASSSRTPEMPASSGPSEAHVNADKSAKKRFLHFLGKKPKPSEESNFRAGLGDDKDFQQKLLKLQGQGSGTAGLHGDGTQTDHIQSRPDTPPQATGMANEAPNAEEITATDEVASATLEETADLRTPHEVAQGILDHVQQTMIDNITAEVMQDVMAELMESMEHDVDTASMEHIWARITAEFTNALQEIAHHTLEEAGDDVTDDVQAHLDAGSQEMVQAVLAHMVEQITPSANHEITEEDEEPEGAVHGPQTQLEDQQSRLNALKQRAGMPDSGDDAPQATLGELEARIGALKQAGQPDAAAAPPATPAASCVIDPKTHEIRQENLKTLAADLGDYVDNMSGLLGQDTVAALKDGLAQLTEVSGKKIAPGESSHGGVGLDARDCYKNLAQECSKQSLGAPDDKREALLTLRALFDELKRHHLASAATPIFKEYAAAELKKMERDNIGITDVRAGASLANTGEQKLGIKKAGVELELKRERKAEVKIDEDNDIMATDTTNYSAGIGGSIKKIFNLKGTGKLTLGGGYRKLGNVPNLLKVLGAESANHRSKIHSLMIGNSAGPEARARDRKYQQGFKLTNAHLLHNEAIAPRYLSSDKIAKGAHNTAAIHAAAELLDQGPGAPGAGGKTLGQILKTAYPALADLPGTPTSAMDYIPLPALSSGSTLRGPETKTTITGVEVGLEGKVKIPKSNFLKDAFDGALKVLKPQPHGKPDKLVEGSGLAGFAEVSTSVKFRRVENALERLKPLHAMVTTGYTKDMRISLNLLGTLEGAGEKNDNATNKRINAKLALYHDLNQAFQPVLDSSQPSHDINFFGPEIDVPATYLGTVRAPKEKWNELLDSVTKACDELQGVYDRFEEAAGTLHMENRNRDPQALKEKYTELQNTAALDILHSVWKQGYPGVSLGEDGQPQTQSLATDSTKRREFIADTHDTISTSLASMGTHLEILKAKILKEVDANPGALDTDPELAGILDKVKQANAKYTSLGKAIEAGNIPISKNELYRYNSLAWAKVNVRNELEVQLGARAGAKWKMATEIWEQLTGKATGVIADLNNSAASMGLTLGFKFTNQDHPNFSRKGDFLEFSVTGGAGNPAAGALVEKFMRQVAKLMYGGPDKFADTEGPGQMAEMIKHAAGAGVLDATQEAQLTWRLHKYSEVDDSEFEFQSFKVSQKRKESVGGSLTIPAGPTSVEVGMKVGQEALIPVFEYTGRDIGHHIINYAPIDKLLKAADAAQKKLPDSEHAHLKKLLDKAENSALKTMLFGTNAIAEIVEQMADTAAEEDIDVPDRATLAAVKQALDGKTTEERANHLLTTPEGRAIFDAYARSSNLAGLDTLRAEAQAQFTAQPKDKLAQTREMLDKDPYLKSQFFSSNGIVDLVSEYEKFKNSPEDPMQKSNFAFFHSKKVEESARASREADAAAAGKDLKTAIPTPLNQEVINVPDREALVAAQQHMKGMKESERADYLLNTEEGRAIFNAYTKVVSTYKDITGSATTNLSYAPYIRQEEQSTLTQGITRPLNTAKNAVLAASPFSGGVADGDRQAEQFLNGRGMFNPDKRQDLRLVMEERGRQGVSDKDVRMQSENWLAQNRIVVADNKMSGTTGLIVSYLQQVTGNYGKLYMREAEKYLSDLKLQNGAHPTPTEMEQVIQAINKDYGRSGGVRMVTPGVDGHPVWTGNIGQQEGGQDFAVIMRDRNEKGEATFSALVHKGDPGFDGFQSRKSADRMMNRLERRQKVQENVTNPESDLTGNKLRQEVDFIDGKGRAGKLAKAATTTIADLRRPVRKELREMSDSDLAVWIGQADQDGNRQKDVDEGRKEQAKRTQMKASVTPRPTMQNRLNDLISSDT